ncbi:MAG: helix-hairpin-helix domain-containing protein [Niabella sp.]|nr:helix-hairpin-helix domain-containing protein [Niabella sp.]
MNAYLRFSKKELAGLLLFIIVILLFAVQPFIHTTANHKRPDAASGAAFSKIISTFEAAENHDKPDEMRSSSNTYSYSKRVYASSTKSTLFKFDPNTLDAAGWLQLGLRERTVQTIIRYRNKGGRFRKPDDLQKIYGLHRDEFERIKPYVVLSTLPYQVVDATPAFSAARKTFMRSALQPIDINTADTTAYKALYGIGSRLAARIVHYREKLGGFYNIGQVGETYGVPDSTFQKIKPLLLLKNPELRKLNINTASYEELNAHPYISSKLAYLVVKHRKIAPIASTEALQALVAQTNDVFEKLEPYIQLNATEALKH